MTTKRLRYLLRSLRQDFPTDLPVRVRRIEHSKHFFGDCALISDAYYLIRINKKHPAYAQEVMLVHEWAHARTWDPKARLDHNHRFGREFGRLIRWYQNEREWELCEP